MKQILLVVHQETSDPGLVGQILRSHGYSLDIRCPALQQKLPTTLDNHDAVVIFGGPMSANDDKTLPFIRAELEWIPLALTSGKPFLGICLGAQMLARVLGATVASHPEEVREIGYVPITPTAKGADDFDQLLHVYHWHQEGFELPSGATLLATGKVFPNQAFRYGQSAYGVQFHPEITAEMMDRWTAVAADQLTLPGAQPRDEQLQQHQLYSSATAKWLDRFLERWLGAENSEATKAA